MESEELTISAHKVEVAYVSGHWLVSRLQFVG